MIETKNLRREFKVGNQIVNAIDGISLKINQGDYVSIMGPSGSGKTTLMNIIGCLDTPTDGTYRLNNVDVQDLSEDELAHIRNKEIGFVFQSFNLLSKTSALENVLLPLKYAGVNEKHAKKVATRTLERIGLGDRIQHGPSELSGGQQQRVAIARALVNEPSILFADEPTGNLDSETGESVLKLFRRLNDEGQTIILITHEIDVANQSNRVITIKDGKIESDNKL